MNKTKWKNEKGQEVKFIKIIDLLIKIANGEERPKEFKYDGNIYTLRADGIYVDIKTNDYFSDAIYYDLGNMNEEVEIIEEEPEIDIQNKKETNWEEIGKMVGKMYLEFAKGFNNALEQLGIKLDDQINNK